MLYRIRKAIAHPDHTVTVTWSDGVEAVVDLSPVIAKGDVFASLQDGHYFGSLGVAVVSEFWPNKIII